MITPRIQAGIGPKPHDLLREMPVRTLPSPPRERGAKNKIKNRLRPGLDGKTSNPVSGKYSFIFVCFSDPWLTRVRAPAHNDALLAEDRDRVAWGEGFLRVKRTAQLERSRHFDIELFGSQTNRGSG